MDWSLTNSESVVSEELCVGWSTHIDNWSWRSGLDRWCLSVFLSFTTDRWSYKCVNLRIIRVRNGYVIWHSFINRKIYQTLYISWRHNNLYTHILWYKVERWEEKTFKCTVRRCISIVFGSLWKMKSPSVGGFCNISYIFRVWTWRMVVLIVMIWPWSYKPPLRLFLDIKNQQFGNL